MLQGPLSIHRFHLWVETIILSGKIVVFTQVLLPTRMPFILWKHGAVWVTYQPGLGAQDVTQLQNLVHGHSYALLSPYPNLPSPIVISAWGVQLKVNSANDPRLAQFLAKYEQGPQTQEPGAACSGGKGTPNLQ